MTSRPPSKLKQLLLRDQLWWRYYQRNADTIRPAVVDAISKVLACGRVIMGYASFVCSNHECSHTKKICFGCKARLCNTCGKKLTDQWIADQKALLPDTEWQHITFTMPDALWELFRINRTLLGERRPLRGNFLIALNVVITQKLLQSPQGKVRAVFSIKLASLGNNPLPVNLSVR